MKKVKEVDKMNGSTCFLQSVVFAVAKVDAMRKNRAARSGALFGSVNV